MVSVRWKKDLAFEAESDGISVLMDGNGSQGLSPMDSLLASIAACSAMDVISILEKKRQTVAEYHIEVEGDRGPSGEWPRPFTAIRVRHILKGQKIDEVAVLRAIELSDEKYCSVMATLRFGPPISSTFEIRS